MTEYYKDINKSEAEYEIEQQLSAKYYETLREVCTIIDGDAYEIVKLSERLGVEQEVSSKLRYLQQWLEEHKNA